MRTRKTKLFIVNPNRQIGARIKDYLKDRFGNRISASVFSGKDCVRHVDKNTDLVVLTDLPKDKHSLGLLKLIKCRNWKTEVLILPKNEDVPRAIQHFFSGARDYIDKRKGTWTKLNSILEGVLIYPIRILAKQFKLSVGLTIFLLIFVSVAVIASLFFLLLKTLEGGK